MDGVSGRRPVDLVSYVRHEYSGISLKLCVKALE